MNAVIGKGKSIYLGASDLLGKLEPLALLVVRLLVARVFWMSGLGKVETLNLLGLRIPTPDMQQSAYFLFKNVFFPDLPENLTNLFTIGSALGELTLPILLVFGFLTRIGALGLLTMTIVIQVFVFPDAWWPTHAWWAALLMILVVKGPGSWSVDRLIGLQR